MDILLNFGLAWVSVLLALILTVVFFTRKAIVKYPSTRKIFIKFNKALRKHHKLIGILLVLIALVHGLFSSEKLLSLNLGTISWLVSILLGVSWMLRKKLIKVKGWMFYHRILVFVFMLSIIIHVVDVGGVQVFNVIRAESARNLAISEYAETPYQSNNTGNSYLFSGDGPGQDLETAEGSTYADGTYTGEATGYQPGLVVSVIIKENEIVSIDVIDHNEINSKYYGPPIEAIPAEIIDTQCLEVDTVSGATYTSMGIINAVRDALSQAMVCSDMPMMTPAPEITPEPDAEPNHSPSPNRRGNKN